MDDWPRRLLSPTAILFWVHGHASLKELCHLHPELNKREGNMLQLLGKQRGSSDRQQFKYGWQDFDQVRWLMHPGLKCPVAVLQPPAEFFQEFKLRPDAADISEQQFVAFVNGNMRVSKGSKKVKVSMEEARLGTAMWRVLLRPPEAAALVSQQPHGSLFAEVAPMATASRSWLGQVME
jgi:hypothetical protein